MHQGPLHGRERWQRGQREYSIAVAGTGSGTYTSLSFTVPSIVSDDERCTRYLL